MRRFKSSKRGHVQKSRKHRLSAENLELGSERLLIGDKRTLVLDLRPADVFAAGHIQAAVHIDLFGVSLIDTDPAPLETFLWMIVHMFEGRGVSEDCRVVVYDDRSGMRAARAFWFLEFFGHTDVQMLDGGFTAWKSASWPVTIDAMVPISHVWKIRRTDERLATWCHVRDRIGHEGVVVVDTRSEGEYLGETVRARRAGAIPGAIHVEWTRNLDPAGAFKTAHELKDMYEKVGVAPGCEVITYCQGGVIVRPTTILPCAYSVILVCATTLVHGRNGPIGKSYRSRIHCKIKYQCYIKSCFENSSDYTEVVT